MGEKVKETFLPIDQYKESYLISNYGNIYSYNSERFLKIQMDKKKYPYVDLWKEGRRKHRRIHILVAKTFIENPMHKKQVNHKDGNIFNYFVENLEWVTEEENIKHAVENGHAIANNFIVKGSIAEKEQEYYANHPE